MNIMPVIMAILNKEKNIFYELYQGESSSCKCLMSGWDSPVSKISQITVEVSNSQHLKQVVLFSDKSIIFG